MSNSQTPEPGTQRILRSTTTGTTRTNPRRRARQSDNDSSLPSQAPKRRRPNQVSEDTFKPRDSTENVPIEVSQEQEEDNITVMNGHLHPPTTEGSTRGHTGSIRSTPNLDAQMTIRGGKPKRAMRGDGATTLAQNQCYSVKILPSTPRELRKEGVEYRASLAGGEQALAVTHDKAFVWQYTAHLPSSNPRTFDVPFPYRPDDPLPFGVLVSNGASSHDWGLLLVSATTGKAMFYDSIDRAVSLGLFQDRKTGTEGAVTGLFSGESVVDLVSAGHAGFVVVLSSGRLAQLTLRDAQGRPKIQNHFLRTADSNSTGFFGSFSRLLTGGFHKEVSAVHTRPLSIRGQMQAIALTEKAELLLWNLDWSGRSDYKASIDFRETMGNELRGLEIPEVSGKADQIKALDFAFLDRSSSTRRNEVATVGAEQPLDILLLLRVGSADFHSYIVAEMNFHESSVEVSRIMQLRKYDIETDVDTQRKPKILIPRPGHTAFVMFQNATVLIAAKEVQDDSPEAQLHASYIQPEPYEEVIYLRREKSLAVLGSVPEDGKGHQAASIAFVRGAGLVRIAATDVNATLGGARIPAKSRIEQAVFYGTMQPDNIVDYSRKSKSDHSIQEVENAALEVSREILRAETMFTAFISPAPIAMDQHLAAKARALEALADFATQNYPALSRGTMWKLLWDAERVAAAQQLWMAFEDHISGSIEQGKRKATLLDELCAWFRDSDQPEAFVQRPDLADLDDVNKFFVGGLHRLGLLLNMVRVFLQSLRSDKDKTPLTILRLVSQANDVWLRTLQTVFDFRSEHCADYGILPELVEDGVLIDQAEYADAPEFWTSSAQIIENTITLTKLSRDFATDFYVPDTMPEAATDYVKDVAFSNPKLVKLYCLQAQEGINVRLSRPGQKDQEIAKVLQREFEEARYDLCRNLAAVGQVESGLQIAEKYRDMHTLTDMIIAEDQYYDEEIAKLNKNDHEDLDRMLDQRQELQKKVKRYFDRFHTAWSTAFFDKLFSGSRVGTQLELAQKLWRKALAEYLRSDPSRAKICWINDVTCERDYQHASEALAQSAESQESKLWAKKVELSMSKLAQLAALEGEDPNKTLKLTNGTSTSKRSQPQDELVVVEVQEKLDAHLRPELFGLIDRQAEIQHCMEKYGSHVNDYPALRQILENALESTLDHKALPVEDLIDVLTLMDMHNDSSADGNLAGAEFLYALIVLDAAASSVPPARFETLLQLIWKRCYIYDNWAELQLSKKKSDEERKQELRHTATWHTLYHALESDFFSKPDRHVRIVAPSECLGAACSPQDLSYRFRSEELLDPILHDLKIQDELLQSYVTDRRLDDIAQECLRDAKAHIENKADERAQMLEQERDFENSFHEDTAINGTETNGHAKGPNGFRPQYSEDFAQLDDADGDIEME